MVTFNQMEKSKLINGLNHVLIAKFSNRRPALAIIKSFFQSLNVKGHINVSLFDSKHVVVECEQFDDFVLIWIKKIWTIDGSTARIFKWDADFHPFVESSITPIWLHLPCLPLFFYDEWALLKIAKSIGRPLFVDKNNINRRKLAYATICVEIDVSKPLIDQVWIRFVGKDSKDIIEGYWQKVVYDFVPPYCSFCHHVGHRITVCKRRVEQQEGKGSIIIQNLESRQDENRFKIKGKKVEADMISDQAVESDCSGVKYKPVVQNLGSTGSKSGEGDSSQQPNTDSAKLLQMPKQFSCESIEEGEIREGAIQDSVSGDGSQLVHLLVGETWSAGEFAAAGETWSAATSREAAGIPGSVTRVPGSTATEEFPAAGENGSADTSWEAAAGVLGSASGLPRSSAGASAAVETWIPLKQFVLEPAAGLAADPAVLVHGKAADGEQDQGKPSWAVMVEEEQDNCSSELPVSSTEGAVHAAGKQLSHSGQTGEQLGKISASDAGLETDVDTGADSVPEDAAKAVAEARAEAESHGTAAESVRDCGNMEVQIEKKNKGIHSVLLVAETMSNRVTGNATVHSLEQAKEVEDNFMLGKTESWANQAEKSAEEKFLLENSRSVVSQEEDSDEDEINGTLADLHKQVMGFKSLKEGHWVQEEVKNKNKNKKQDIRITSQLRPSEVKDCAKKELAQVYSYPTNTFPSIINLHIPDKDGNAVHISEIIEKSAGVSELSKQMYKIRNMDERLKGEHGLDFLRATGHYDKYVTWYTIEILQALKDHSQTSFCKDSTTDKVTPLDNEVIKQGLEWNTPERRGRDDNT